MAGQTRNIMHRFHDVSRQPASRWRLIAMLVLAILWLPFGNADVAFAEVPANGLSQAAKAFADFQALKGRGQIPLLSDPAAAVVLSRLWDARGVIGQPPFAAGDEAPLQKIVNIGVGVLAVYIKAGQAGGSPADDPYYQAEIARAEAFLLQASPALLEAADATVSRSVDLNRLRDPQMSGLKRIAQGVRGIETEVQVAISTISGSRFAPQNQQVIAQALAQTANRLAIQFSPNDRSLVIQSSANAIAKSDPQAMLGLERLMVAMATKSCTNLCALSRRAEGGQPQLAAAPQPALQPAPPAAQPVAIQAGAPPLGTYACMSYRTFVGIVVSSIGTLHLVTPTTYELDVGNMATGTSLPARHLYRCGHSWRKSPQNSQTDVQRTSAGRALGVCQPQKGRIDPRHRIPG